MSMIDAYTVGVNLVLGGDLAEGIKTLIPGLEQLDKHLTSANAEAKGLAQELRGIGSAAGGIRRTADALARMNDTMATLNQRMQDHREGGGFVFGEPPAGGGRDGGSRRQPGGALVEQPYRPDFTMPPASGGVPAVIEDEPFNAEPRMPLYPNGRRGGAEEVAEERARRGHHMPGAFDAVIPALLEGEAIKSVFGASFDVGAKESELLANGWTKEQVDKARGLAQLIQTETPGATIGGGLEIVKDLGVLFRNKDGTPDTDVALQALPEYSKNALLLGMHGHGDGVAELFKAAQAGDLKGAINKPGTDEIDPARFSDFIHNVMLADRVTGGRVTPQMILQNMRTGGTSAAAMSDNETFGANLALLEGLGSQAATALQGFNRQFGAGRMGKGTATELEGIFPGLVGHWHTVGMGQVMVDPGAMGDPLEMAKNPLEWIKQNLQPGVDRLIRSRMPGFDALPATDKQVLESQEASRLSSTTTGAKAISETFRIYAQMQREAAAFEQEKHVDIYGIEQQNNPEVKAKALSAALNAFEVSLGEAAVGPAVATLTSITGVLNDLAAFAKANPTGSKIALEGLAAGLAALGVAAVIAAITALGAPALGLAAVAAGLVALWEAVKSFGGIGGVVKKLNNGIMGGPGWDDPKSPAFNPLPYIPGAYHPPPGQSHGPTVQQITYLQVDGRTLAKSVTHHQIDMMGGQVSGTLRPDPSIAPQYGAHLVET